METRKPDIEVIGPCALHNQACAVSHRIGEHAVLDMDSDTFQPSWHAQSHGWKLVRADNWFQRFLIRVFFE